MLYITTWEEERALKTLYRLVKDVEFIKTERTLFVWRITTGIEKIENEIDIAAGGKSEADTSDPPAQSARVHSKV